MYRYSARKYTDALLSMGGIRVGTLHDFRKNEHKRGIFDPQEGKKEVFHAIDKLLVTDPKTPEVKAIEQFGILKFEDGVTNVQFEGITLLRPFDVLDCFILCTSKTFSRKTMREFEGADSCYQILNPNRFYGILTEVLNSFYPVIFRGVHEVVYQDRKEKWNGKDCGHHPALIKEKEFRRQSELRAIWQPRYRQPIQPIIFADYRLTEACRALDI